MTYYEDDGGRGEVVPELTFPTHTDHYNGDYVKLRCGPDDSEPEATLEAVAEPPPPTRRWFIWYWVKLVLLFVCLGLLAAVFIKWVGPFFMDKVFNLFCNQNNSCT